MKKAGLLGLLLMLPWSVWAADLVKVVDPWVREAPPTSAVMAAYMGLENGGQAALHLVGVTSPLFAKVEMHQTVTKDGMAMMEPVQHMEVPAG
ncbi:MAG: copper chaperone PCu(A)C, partial [Magnetococcales bacterium]|nr:copper chaperone PCu(A)C [Magnetococcales bacterium]